MNVTILKTQEAISAAAGEILCAAVREKPNAVMGFATGASPVPTYAYMVWQCAAGKVSFAQMRTFNLDEYCDLPKSHSESYYSFMFRNLFGRIDVQAENVDFLNGNAADIPAECARYEAAIAKVGGIDVQLLGIGHNGHIGFNEPSDSFAEASFQIALTQSTIDANKMYFPDGGMPTKALTMGIGSILRARKIVLIATGAGKAQAVKDMIEGAVSPQCPASVLQNHADVQIFLDEAAASLLTK